MKAALLTLLATTGCYFHAVETTHVRPVGEPVMEPVVLGRVGPMELYASNHERDVEVRVQRPRQCIASAIQNVEIVHGKKSDLAAERLGVDMPVGGGGPIGLFIVGGVLFAEAIILPVSAVATAIEVGTDKPRIERSQRRLAPRGYPCPIDAANELVRVQLPSGHALDLFTNAGGVASFTIPDDEPMSGVIYLGTAEATRTLAYDRRTSAERIAQRDECRVRRSAALRTAQQESDVQERVRQLQAAPRCDD